MKVERSNNNRNETGERRINQVEWNLNKKRKKKKKTKELKRESD